MFIAAVLESLKDLHMRHPTEGEPIPSANGNCGESFEKEDGDASSTSESAGASNLEHASTLSGSSDHTTETETPSPGASSSSSAPSSGPLPPAPDAGAEEASDVHGGGAKATLTEEKDPASNVMEGLMRRWDFNFFKNGQ